MKRKIIIFGTRDLAEIAYKYITEHTNYTVEGFTVTADYKDRDFFYELPVITFDNIEERYPPKDFLLFAPISPKKMNQERTKIYIEGKRKGYEFFTYISPFATVLSKKIGENCFIFENNTIQPFVEIGSNCIFWSGNHIGHHSKIEDHVFFTSHVVLSGHCVVKPYCYFGVNSTIRDGLILAEGTLVAMSACITKNTDCWTVYMGVPAKPAGSSLDVNL